MLNIVDISFAVPWNLKFTSIGHSVFGKHGDEIVTLDTLLEVDPPIAQGAASKSGDALYAEAALEDRSAPRRKIRMPAIFRPSGSEGFSVTIHDLSLSGFSAEAFTCQPIGTRVWITIPGLAPLQAEIARNDRTIVGCAFTQLLNQAVLDNLVARYRVEE